MKYRMQQIEGGREEKMAKNLGVPDRRTCSTGTAVKGRSGAAE
jgi:hypothetical protein